MSESTNSTKKLIKTIKDIEKTVILMKKHKVSEMEIDGIRIKINAFDPLPTKPEKASAQAGDDEDLFWSAQQ